MSGENRQVGAAGNGGAPARGRREGPGIGHITYVFPEDVLDNDQLRQRFEFKPDFLEVKLGIDRRYRARWGEATSDLCAAAVGKLLAESGESPAAIDALIVVTLNPDYIMPHTAALVQEKCGLPKRVASFDVALGCSGYVYGLSLADSMMRADGFSRVVLVTAVNFSRITDPESRATVPIFGDAATATLLTTDNPRYFLGRCTYGTDGSLAEAIIVRGSGTAGDGDGKLEMDGRGVFNFMMREVPPDVERCLELNGLVKDDVALWVFHQASNYMVENLADRLRIPRERVILDLQDGGNTSSCTIPVTLRRRVLDRRDLPEIIGLSGFGVGASWASSFLFKNPRED
jgi:3-oxoacyl-[acyl-carrier-protein] synthase-3